MRDTLKKSTALLLVIALTFPAAAFSQVLPYMPPVGQMLAVSTEKYDLPYLVGMRFNGDDPFRFTFILDKGDLQAKKHVLTPEIEKINKYFLAALTIPEKDLWVNLSPYEKGRITTQALGATDLGKDMLGEDYVLKQLAASLTHPDLESGKAYWHNSANSNNSTNSLTKIWIVPDVIKMIESSDRVVITQATLKVKSQDNDSALKKLVPVIEREVNNSERFAHLRQIYRAVIMASWFKRKLKDTVLSQSYFDQNKIKGADTKDAGIKEKIYDEYVKAFNQGVYKAIKTENSFNRMVKKSYFCGGASLKDVPRLSQAGTTVSSDGQVEMAVPDKAVDVGMNLELIPEPVSNLRDIAGLAAVANKMDDNAAIDVIVTAADMLPDNGLETLEDDFLGRSYKRMFSGKGSIDDYIRFIDISARHDFMLNELNGYVLANVMVGLAYMLDQDDTVQFNPDGLERLRKRCLELTKKDLPMRRFTAAVINKAQARNLSQDLLANVVVSGWRHLKEAREASKTFMWYFAALDIDGSGFDSNDDNILDKAFKNPVFDVVLARAIADGSDNDIARISRNVLFGFDPATIKVIVKWAKMVGFWGMNSGSQREENREMLMRARNIDANYKMIPANIDGVIDIASRRDLAIFFAHNVGAGDIGLPSNKGDGQWHNGKYRNFDRQGNNLDIIRKKTILMQIGFFAYIPNDPLRDKSEYPRQNTVIDYFMWGEDGLAPVTGKAADNSGGVGGVELVGVEKGESVVLNGGLKLSGIKTLDGLKNKSVSGARLVIRSLNVS